jgi:hypothetical protein
MEQRKVSEVPSRDTKTNSFQNRRTEFRTKVYLDNEKCIIIIIIIICKVYVGWLTSWKATAWRFHKADWPVGELFQALNALVLFTTLTKKKKKKERNTMEHRLVDGRISETVSPHCHGHEQQQQDKGKSKMRRKHVLKK